MLHVPGAALPRYNVTPFDEKIFKLMERIAYRRMDSPEDMEQVYRLRYDAYVRAGMISKGEEELNGNGWSDPHDSDPNCFNFGIYHDEVLVGCMRVHVASPANPTMPSNKHASDHISRWLGEGHTLVDCSRFAHLDGLKGDLRLLPFVTVRLTGMAGVHFNAKYLVQVVRKRHAAFYVELNRSEHIEDRDIGFDNGEPFLASVLRGDIPYQRKFCLEARPYLLSTAAEREALFSATPTTGFVKPTARDVVYGGEDSGY